MRYLFNKIAWSLLFMIAATGCESSGLFLDDDQSDGTGSSSDSSSWDDPEGVNEWIDNVLSQKYLYNEEYDSIKEKDFDKPFDSFFYDNLKSLKGINTLDYKQTAEQYGGTWALFSYIEGTNPDGETRSTLTNETDFGFINFSPIYNKSTIGLYVLALYNDSPADNAKIRRGMIITSVDGVSLTESNYEEYFNTLLSPTKGKSLKLGVYTSGEGTTYHTITTATYDHNPVLRCEVIDKENKVGYLNYTLFNSLYDNKLTDAFKQLKEEKIEELILDLRYNGGGYVSSASLMTSAISSTPIGSSQVFSYYHFNKSLTKDYSATAKWTGLKFDSASSLFYETLTGLQEEYLLSTLGKTIYCLVSYYTASASELVINALRGMGYNVVLIGETTRGKNVGMYVFEKSFEDYSYEMTPITFVNYNCLQEGGYEDGIEPTYEITTLDSLKGYFDFSAEEPLISKALSIIKGESQDNAISITRSTDSDQLSIMHPIAMPTSTIHGSLKRAKL